MTSKKPSTLSFEQRLNPQEAIVNIKCLTIRNAATSEGFFRGQLEWTRKALVFFLAKVLTVIRCFVLVLCLFSNI